MEIPKEELATRILEIENDPKVSLKVPLKLTEPDILIIAEKRARSPQNKGMLYQGPGLINVTAKHVDRALRVYDTIIKVFRARGHEFTGNNAIVDGQRYRITIREKFKKIEGSYHDQTPTGILCLQAYHAYPVIDIYDSKNVLIEDRIAKVVALLELEVEDLKRIWAANAKRETERKENERLRQEHIEKQHRELSDFRQLLNSAHRAHQVILIRNYIRLVETKIAQSKNSSADLLQWINWANEKADWYDPFLEKEVELLKGVDKATLVLSVVNDSSFS